MNIFVRWLSAILIVLTVMVILGGIKYNKVMAAIAFGESFPEPSAAVNTFVTEVAEHKEEIRVTGQILAKQSLMITSELGGKVTKVGFVPGDTVKKGQLLIAQDIAQEKAQLEQVKAQINMAQKSVNRLQNLLAEQRVSQEQYDQAVTNLTVLKAQKVNLEVVIKRKTISAPFSGRVGLDKIEVGSLLPPETNVTFIVANDKQIWLDFQLPQTQQQLVIGAEVWVKVIGSGKHSDKLTAKIIARDSALNSNSRHMSYRAELDNSKGYLSHNQIVSVLVPVAIKNAVLVPNSAVTRDHAGEYVYLLEKDQNQQYRAKPIKVTLGQRNGDNQLITSGLSGGEYIATQGAFKLREGLLVYPNDNGFVAGAQ